jgi:hypothetical protein
MSWINGWRQQHERPRQKSPRPQSGGFPQHQPTGLLYHTPWAPRDILSLECRGLISGAQLSVDDLGLIEEMLAEIRDLLELLK